MSETVILERVQIFWRENAEAIAALSEEKFLAFVALLVELIHAITARLIQQREQALATWHSLLDQLEGTDPNAMVGG